MSKSDGAKPAGSDIERLMEKVSPEPNSGCWLWTAYATPKGYGRLHYRGRPHHAHRVAYEEIVGPVPDGMVLDHLCRTRCCVNPAHLEPVTNAENIRRGAVLGSYKRPLQTHCLRGHELTEENTAVVQGKRQCVSCKRRRKREYDKRRRARI